MIKSGRYKETIEIRDSEDAKRATKHVINTLGSIPSMCDKLPNYLMERIDKVIEYSDKYGWEWLDD